MLVKKDRPPPMNLQMETLEDMIQALADHQLDWEEEKAVRCYLEANPSALEEYKKILQQNKLLQKWWFSTHPRKN
jgi:hypothetical protein